MFLADCSSKFGIASTDLFTAQDFEEANLNAVVKTILALSRSIQREESKRDEVSSSFDTTRDTATFISSPSRSSPIKQMLQKQRDLNTSPTKKKLVLVCEDDVLAEYQLGASLGRGSFGSVHSALNLKTGMIRESYYISQGKSLLSNKYHSKARTTKSSSMKYPS